MNKKDVFSLFPYLKKSKRVNIFLRERTKHFPHYKELNKKSTEELIIIINSLEKNISSLEKCMEKHSKNILDTKVKSILERELINFIVEAEMKRLCIKKSMQIRDILKNQRKITKYVK